MHLCFAIGAELLQIQIGDINPLRAARLQNTGIPGALQLGKVGYPIKTLEPPLQSGTVWG